MVASIRLTGGNQVKQESVKEQEKEEEEEAEEGEEEKEEEQEEEEEEYMKMIARKSVKVVRDKVKLKMVPVTSREVLLL